MVGVTAEEISVGMLKLQKNLVAGSEETGAALGRLGLSFSALRSMTPEDQLATVVEGLARIPDPAERSALAMELLGKGGAALVPLGENLRGVMERAEELGVVMSANVIAAADDLGDSVGALGATWTGLQNNLVSVIVTSEPLHVLINGLTDLLGQLSVMVRDNQGAFRSLVDAGVVFVAEALVQLVNVSSYVVDAWSGLQIIATGLGAYFESLGLHAIALWDILSDPGNAPQTFRNLQQSLSDLESRTQQAITAEMTANARRQEVVGQVKTAFEGLRDKVANAVGVTHQASAAAEQHAATEGRRAVSLKQAKDAAKEAAEGLKTYADVTKSAQAELRQLGAAAEGSLAGKLQSISEKTRASMEKLNEALKKSGDVAGFERAAAEVQRLDAALRAAAMNDARIGLMGKSMRDLRVEARQAVVVFQDFAAQGGQLSQYSDDALRKMLQGFEDLASGIDKSSQEYRDLAGAIDTVKSHMADTGVLTNQQVDDWERNYEASSKYWDEQDKKQEEAQRQWEEQNLKVQDFRSSLDQVASVLGALGATNLGGLISSLTAGADAGQQMANSLRNISKNGLTLQNAGSLVAGGAAAVGSFMQATDKRTAGQRALGGAMVGAGVGAKIGSLAGPIGGAIGAIAGGLIGGIAGAFRKPGWVKAADAASKEFGFKVSDELGKAVEQTSKSMKLGRQDASLLHISDAMAESNKDAREFSGSVTKLMDRIKSGAIPAKEGMAELGKSFTAVADAAAKAGSVGDRAMLDIIRRSRELGMEVPEISEYVKGQLQAATQGVASLVGQMSEVEGKKVFGGIQIVDTQSAQDQATVFSSVFWASVKEQGIVQAADAMREPFATLKAKIGESLGGDAASAILAPMERIFALTEEGNPFRGAVEGAEGLRQALEGLANSGYLTTESFQAVQNQAVAAFSQMTSAGAAPSDALRSMAPLLQSLVSASQNYGLELDANTQSLISQAQQAGVAFQTDPQQRMVQALEAIAVKLGADLPAAANTAAASMGALAGSTSASAGQMSMSTDAAFASMSMSASANLGAMNAGVSAAMGEMVATTGATTSTAMQYFGTMASDLVNKTSSATGAVTSVFQTMAANAGSAIAGVGASLDTLNRPINIPVSFDVGPMPDMPGGGPPPDIPQFASGGIIEPKPGGTIARVAEAGQAELVAPVRAFSADLAQQLAARVAGQGGGGGVTMNVTVNVNGAGDPRAVAQQVLDQLRLNYGGATSVLREMTRGRA